MATKEKKISIEGLDLSNTLLGFPLDMKKKSENDPRKASFLRKMLKEDDARERKHDERDVLQMTVSTTLS